MTSLAAAGRGKPLERKTPARAAPGRIVLADDFDTRHIQYGRPEFQASRARRESLTHAHSIHDPAKLRHKLIGLPA